MRAAAVAPTSFWRENWWIALGLVAVVAAIIVIILLLNNESSEPTPHTTSTPTAPHTTPSQPAPSTTTPAPTHSSPAPTPAPTPAPKPTPAPTPTPAPKTPSEPPAPKPKVKIGSGAASGEHATAQATGFAPNPAQIELRVNGSPSQGVALTWTLSCQKPGGETVKKNGESTATLPATITLPLPSGVNGCEVTAKAQLSETGAAEISIYNQEKS